MPSTPTDLQKKVADLVAANGETATFTVQGGEVYDRSTGTVTATPELHTATVVPWDYSSADIDGDVVRVGDTRVIVPAKDLTFAPEPNQQVSIDSGTWNVQRVLQHRWQGAVIAWELQLRKG